MIACPIRLVLLLGACIVLSPICVAQRGDKTALEQPGERVRGELHYYLTRIGLTGLEERVPVGTVFPPSSTVNLNIEPTLDGRLLVFAADGPAQPRQFFPKPPYRKALVRAGERVRIPLRFNDTPGESHFIVLVIDTDPRTEAIRKEMDEDKVIDYRLVRNLIPEGGKGVELADGPERRLGPGTWARFVLRNR